MSRASIISFLLAAAAPLGAAAQGDPAFDGVWEGQIEVVTTHGVKVPSRILPRAESPMPLTLEIRGRGGTVRFGRETILSAGSFYVERFDAAAHVIAQIATPLWVETWQLSLTKKDADTVLVYLWRVVNDMRRRPDQDYSKFAWAGVGELRRAQSPANGESAIHPQFEDIFDDD
jgi:hypothetical protein